MFNHSDRVFAIGGHVAPTVLRAQAPVPPARRPRRQRRARADHYGNVRLFEKAPRRTLGLVSRLFTPMRLGPGRTLMREGDSGREFVLLLEGTATVRRDGVEIARLGPGDHAGEIALLPDLGTGGKRTATVTIDGTATVAVCNRREFQTLIDADDDTRRRLEDGAWELVG